MTAPANANEIAANLSRLALDLASLATALDLADKRAVNAREDYTMAYAKAFLRSEGAMDVRKQQALVDTHAERLMAEGADQIVRGIRKQMETIKVRIEVGRSVGAAVRTEMNLAGGPGE